MSRIIRSYGLFWKADDVYWTTSQMNADLCCHPKNRKSIQVNMRDQVGIYVLYEGHNMVYVGQTGSGSSKLFSRLKRHRHDHLQGRWDTFSWFGLRHMLRGGQLAAENMRTTSSVRVSLNQIEAVLLAASEPYLNKQGGRFGKRATQFMQIRDERLGITDSEMLREIWERLRES